MNLANKNYINYYKSILNNKLSNSIKKILFNIIILLSNIENNKIYCEHSINYKNKSIKNCRGLICITNLSVNDFSILYKLYNSLILDKKYLSIVKQKLTYENRDRVEFGFDLNNKDSSNDRYKFYYIDNSIKTYSDLKCNYVIKCNDYFFDGRIDEKQYFVFEGEILKKNLSKLKKKFNNISNLFGLVDRVNIAFKENQNKVTLDFKIIRGDNLFINELSKKNKYIEEEFNNISKKYLVTFIAIKYDFSINNFDFDDFTLYFKEKLCDI